MWNDIEFFIIMGVRDKFYSIFIHRFRKFFLGVLIEKYSIILDIIRGCVTKRRIFLRGWD